MSKYSREQLKRMAQIVLRTKDAGLMDSINFNLLVVTVAGKTRLPESEVIKRIENLANG